jgi:hypothetical protein
MAEGPGGIRKNAVRKEGDKERPVQEKAVVAKIVGKAGVTGGRKGRVRRRSMEAVMQEGAIRKGFDLKGIAGDREMRREEKERARAKKDPGEGAV